MFRTPRRLLASTIISLAIASVVLTAQRGGGMSPEQAARRHELEKELQSIAVVERKVMMPMRDGVRLATDIYCPRRLSPTARIRSPTIR